MSLFQRCILYSVPKSTASVSIQHNFLYAPLSDTAFMFIGGLLLVKIFQQRHPDIHANAFSVSNTEVAGLGEIFVQQKFCR